MDNCWGQTAQQQPRVVVFVSLLIGLPLHTLLGLPIHALLGVAIAVKTPRMVTSVMVNSAGNVIARCWIGNTFCQQTGDLFPRHKPNPIGKMGKN
jgi:hypothetical protein